MKKLRNTDLTELQRLKQVIQRHSFNLENQGKRSKSSANVNESFQFRGGKEIGTNDIESFKEMVVKLKSDINDYKAKLKAANVRIGKLEKDN